VIESLLDYSNRYTGPETSCATANNFNSAETLHRKLVDILYRFCKPATQASFEGVCRRYVDWCKSQPRIECAYKFFANPADTVEAFLESDAGDMHRRVTSLGSTLKMPTLNFTS